MQSFSFGFEVAVLEALTTRAVIKAPPNYLLRTNLYRLCTYHTIITFTIHNVILGFLYEMS